MGVKLIRYSLNDEISWGIEENEKLYRISSDQPLKEIIQSKIYEIEDKEQVKETVNICSPITKDAQLFCLGANYGTHREECGLDANKPPFNLFFSKASSSLTSATSDIICPPHVELLDYEIELGLVIKQTIQEAVHVTEGNLADYVAGLVIMNDISARDVQMLEGQWLKGKSYRTFAPAGPYVYLLDEDEIQCIHNLEIILKVNEEVRQQASTIQLLYKPAETLTEFSQLLDLHPGDVILTGTTGGVGLTLNEEMVQILQDKTLNFKEKKQLFVENQLQSNRYLRHNDVIEATIFSEDGHIHLGTQRNRVVMSKVEKQGRG
ncbi:fumarylacetoacetate hydrolase family protein [Alkalihalobacillus sp. BA299]|uniref:fumarylacetoacetate hydrolase family protein n=1 Tax=Alkalihalobacillus sp. BA299 TaxID=2815938 RepID=UPI001ADA516A|nr:fumarylacetoacetate hydrolase family protein [Alkalihalobacillus sp. BA299]